MKYLSTKKRPQAEARGNTFDDALLGAPGTFKHAGDSRCHDLRMALRGPLPENFKRATRVALLVESPLSCVVGNMIIFFTNSNDVPRKLFFKEEAGRQWLRASTLSSPEPEQVGSLSTFGTDNAKSEKLLETLAALNFSARLEAAGETGQWQALFTRVNMLAEELERSATSKTALEVQHDRLAEAEAFVGSLMQNTPTALFCKDAAEALWGLKAERVIGKNDYDLFSAGESDWFRRKDEEVMRNGETQAIDEEKITLGDGRVLYLRTKKVPLRGHYLLGVSENITGQKMLQAQMIQSSKMSALGEMAAGVAHEINNPLTIIQAKACYLLSLLDEGNLDMEMFRKELTKIDDTVDRIGKVVRGLGLFSRNASGDTMARVKLSRIISDTVELCRERFKVHGIELRMDCPQGITLECRAAEISQVIMNLLNNAHDAVEVLADRWVEVEVRELGPKATITITDSGNGIKEAVAARILDPFFTTKEVGKGTGLGLSISNGIVESHRGRLTYDASSKNTRFTIELPLHQ